MSPLFLCHPSQGWYWTKEWQQVEKNVDGQIEKGDVSPTFQTAEEGIKWLKE
jgi:hypothetical protein